MLVSAESLDLAANPSIAQGWRETAALIDGGEEVAGKLSIVH